MPGPSGSRGRPARVRRLRPMIDALPAPVPAPGGRRPPSRTSLLATPPGVRRPVGPLRTEAGAGCLGVAGPGVSDRIARRPARGERPGVSRRQGGRDMTRIAVYDTTLRDGSQGEG